MGEVVQSSQQMTAPGEPSGVSCFQVPPPIAAVSGQMLSHGDSLPPPAAVQLRGCPPPAFPSHPWTRQAEDDGQGDPNGSGSVVAQPPLLPRPAFLGTPRLAIPAGPSLARSAYGQGGLLLLGRRPPRKTRLPPAWAGGRTFSRDPAPAFLRPSPSRGARGGNTPEGRRGGLARGRGRRGGGGAARPDWSRAAGARR